MHSDADLRLSFVTQQLPAIFWTTDRDLRFSSVMGGGLATIGLSPDRVVGVSLADFFAGDPGAAVNLSAHAAALAGQGTSTDARFGSRVYQCRIDPLRNAEGDITGTIGVALDITERKLMEAKLIQAERLASMGTLAAGVAHEINNPLTYVMANIGFVAERLHKLLPGPADADLARQMEELRAALLEAQEGAIRVRQIVRDLKTLARGDEERYGPVDVRRVIESSIGLVANEIGLKATLVRDLGDVPIVEASESRLGQVLLNLLLNASQAIKDGHVADNEIRVGTRTDAAGRAVISITDTGAGISAAVMGRIFDPFFTTKPVGVGTGLGLFICHGIVKALGGEIAVESALGRGTTFRVLLPPARPGKSRASAQPTR
ncbi:MAG: ATP-binding protein [Bacteroidota bacterium]